MADDDRGKGISRNRKCRDVIFLIAFGVFCVGMFVVMGVALDGGDPRRLYYPKDSRNFTCGLGSKANLTRLVFPAANQLPSDLDKQICVKECPTKGPFENSLWCFNGLDPIPREHVTCEYEVDEQGLTITPDLIVTPANPNGVCWCNFASSSLLRRCFPKDLTPNTTAAVEDTLTSRPEIAQVFSDVANTWQIIMGYNFVDIFLCFIWLILISVLCKPVIWLTVIGFLCLMVAIAVFLWEWVAELDAASKLGSSDDSPKPENESSLNANETVRVLAWVWTVMTIVAIVMVIALRNRIRLAIEIVKEASKAVRSMPLIIFFPIIIFTAMTLYLVYWVAVAVYLASYEDPAIGEDEGYSESDIETMRLYWLFAFFWVMNLLIAINQTTIAGGVATWYWTANKLDLPPSPVKDSFFRVLRYHLGSLCFGSLILAIVETIRAVVYYFQKQLEGKEGVKWLKWLLCIVQCCLSCVDRFLRFLNRNAYIMIAVYGGSFCSSAKRAFELLLNNILRVALVTFVSEYIVFLGKLCVTLIAGLSAAGVIRERDDVGYWFFPVFFIMVFAYFIAKAFFLVYEMAIDTILLCFLDEDDLIKRGQGGGTVHMSKNLQKFIEKTHQESMAELKVKKKSTVEASDADKKE